MIRKPLLCAFIILFSILSSCNQGNDSSNEKDSILLQNAIREILLNNVEYNSAIIQFETKPIYKTFYSQKREYPPPPETLIFSSEKFNLLVEKKFLKVDEATYMLSNIDSTRIFQIDSSKINQPVIRQRVLDSLFKGSNEKGYKELNSKYGTNSFIKFGTPMFNSAMNKLLITTEIYSDRELNEDLIYILEFQENKWDIKYKLGLN